MAIKREDLIGSLEQKKACEYLLEKLAGRSLCVIENKTQHSIRNIEEHSIILDLLAEDSEHNIYKRV